MSARRARPKQMKDAQANGVQARIAMGSPREPLIPTNDMSPDRATTCAMKNSMSGRSP
jgi:hypothetical protein